MFTIGTVNGIVVVAICVAFEFSFVGFAFVILLSLIVRLGGNWWLMIAVFSMTTACRLGQSAAGHAVLSALCLQSLKVLDIVELLV